MQKSREQGQSGEGGKKPEKGRYVMERGEGERGGGRRREEERGKTGRREERRKGERRRGQEKTGESRREQRRTGESRREQGRAGENRGGQEKREQSPAAATSSRKEGIRRAQKGQECVCIRDCSVCVRICVCVDVCVCGVGGKQRTE